MRGLRAQSLLLRHVSTLVMMYPRVGPPDGRLRQSNDLKYLKYLKYLPACVGRGPASCYYPFPFRKTAHSWVSPGQLFRRSNDLKYESTSKVWVFLRHSH